SNASPRCPALTAMPTLASPTGTTPIRCTIATRRSGQRRLPCRASCRIPRSALPAAASYSSRVTRRPEFSLRVVPRKSTDAPAAGSPTAASKPAGSIGASTIANRSATAHRRKERHLVAVGQLVLGVDVALVDGDAYAHGTDRRLGANQRVPQGPGRRSRAHRAHLARTETLSQRGKEPEPHAHRLSLAAAAPRARGPAAAACASPDRPRAWSPGGKR